MLSSNAVNLANRQFLSMKKNEHYLTIKQTSDDASNYLKKIFKNKHSKYALK